MDWIVDEDWQLLNGIGLTQDWHWIGMGLGVDWQIGNESTLDWKIGPLLASDCNWIGTGLAPDWNKIGNALTLDWHSIEIGWALDWHQIGNRLALD